MPRFTARVLALLCSFAAIAALRAQDLPAAPPATTPLTLEECIARALRKNFDLQIQGYSTDIARESLEIAKADFDPTLTASVNRNLSQAATATSSLDGTVREGQRNDSTSASIGVNQRIPQTGAVVGLSTGVTRGATNSSNALLNPNYGNTVTATISQPLLKNFGPKVGKANVERNKLGLGIATLNYKSRVLTVVRDTENAYNNLVSARETLRIRQLSLELAQRLLDENTARRSSGVATDLDVLTAEVGVANSRRAAIQAEQTVRNAEDSLLGLFTPENFDLRPGVVTFAPYNEPAPSFPVSYKRALDNQPDYYSALATVKQLEIDLSVAKQNRLPALNLDGRLGYSANDRSYYDVIAAIPNRHGNNWSIGLSYTMPWRMKADTARYRSTFASLNSQKARLAQFEQSLLIQVRTAIRSVETNIASVDIAAKATELSAKQYELQKARFDAGLSTSRLVLQAQDDLEIARLAELSAKVTLRAAVAELHRLEGTSLKRFNINLPE
ncbi:MAG TPA: TolC family protein [Opitutaceae bacterium]|nr:TolC family protein [Opitutaceae bacterium]